MTASRRKPRWTAEQRAAKGRSPQRRSNRRDDNTSSGPMNRKQRRALQFGTAEGAPTQRDTERRDDRPRGGDRRDDRRGAGRNDRHGSDRDDRYRSDRDDRERGDRDGYRGRDDRYRGRDERPRGGNDRYDRRDDRPRRDDRYSKRDDRYGNREDRYSKRDDRYGNREDRYSKRDDRYGNRDDRYSKRDDRYSKRDDRPRRDDRFDNRDERPRRDDRYRDDRGGHRQSSRPPHRDIRRPHEPRGHEDRRGHHDRHQDGHDVESDQMSWTAGAAEEVQGEVTSGFFELGVAEQLVRQLSAQGITEPFPIQAATIGDAIAGKDVLGRGRTGSGKTLAFGLPMLTRLAEGTAIGAPRCMILTPTRELALQIADNLSPLAAAVGLDLTLIAGGMSYGPQLRAFERGVDIVVATPGRLIDLVEQGAADLSQVEVTVLDEADHMADMGFLTEVRSLLDATPEGGQRLLFSATLDNAVGSLVKIYLNDPVTHEVDSGKNSVSTMVHRPLLVKPHHKNQITAEIANREGRTVLFARTQMGTDRIAGQLRDAGVMAGSLHGGLTQGARARILAAFREGTVPVLVATDVAARGIHVDDVSLVLQVDPPRDSKDYLHRAGRTARAGQEGVVTTIVLPHQRKMGRRLLDQAGVGAAYLEVEPGSPELRDATGAQPTSGTAIPEEDYLALIAPKQQQRKRQDGRGRRRPDQGRGRRGGYRGDRH